MSKWVYVALGAGVLWILFSGKKRREQDAQRSTDLAFRRLAQPSGEAPYISRMAADLGIEV